MFARNATDYDTVFFVIVPETDVPRPLLDEAGCPDGKQLGCADGTCLPDDYFCDGSVDCPDGSDEGYCDVDNDPNSATPCNPTTCTPPDCFCSRDGKKQQRNITTATNFTLWLKGTHIPGRLNPGETPQMILLTFDDAINFENWEMYTHKLFTADRTNPNGCPIVGTFYVSHQYTNYQQVQKMWNKGHEIAVHSIT